MTNNIPCRHDLLHWINVVSFAVDDAQLFLDTHPDNQAALSFFQEYSKLRKEALADYSKFYGPLTIDTANMNCRDKWTWINEPWPWEGGC